MARSISAAFQSRFRCCRMRFAVPSGTTTSGGSVSAPSVWSRNSATPRSVPSPPTVMAARFGSRRTSSGSMSVTRSKKMRTSTPRPMRRLRNVLAMVRPRPLPAIGLAKIRTRTSDMLLSATKVAQPLSGCLTLVRLLCCRARQQFFGASDELVELDGFIEVFADAQAFGVHLVTSALVAGDHDDKGLGTGRLAGLDLLEHQKPAAAGEHHVEHDQIGLILLGQFDGFIAILGGIDGGAGRLKSGLHARQNVVVVIDQKNFFAVECAHGVSP